MNKHPAWSRDEWVCRDGNSLSKRTASFGVYWLFQPSEWREYDDLFFPMLDRVHGWRDAEGFRDCYVLFEGTLSLAAVFYQGDHHEPTSKHIEEFHEKWARTSGDGLFLSVQYLDGRILCLRQNTGDTLEVL